MTDKKQGYQPKCVGDSTNPPNCGSGVQPPNTGRVIIDIPADGNYIEILGHRIDGFESFEAFLEHLKKYAELEETVNRQKAEIDNYSHNIKQLTAENMQLHKDLEYAKVINSLQMEELQKEQAEIERLAKLLDDKCDRCIEKERTEAVKEFANELRRVFAGHSDYHGDTILTKIACLREGKVIKCAEPIDTNKIKAEAVKEFAERFKAKAWVDKTLLGFPYYQITFRTFNNLVKEMVGETNEQK